MAVLYQYTKRVLEGHEGTDVNSDVLEIFNRYFDQGKIVEVVETEDGDLTHTSIEFLDSDSYTAWFAEIDAIDTTPPATIEYVSVTEPF